MNEIIRHLEACSGYITLGMYEDAWNELESIPPELRAKVDVIELRLEIYQALGKWESARVLAESMVKRDPENPNWWIAWAHFKSLLRPCGEDSEVRRGTLHQDAQRGWISGIKRSGDLPVGEARARRRIFLE